MNKTEQILLREAGPADAPTLLRLMQEAFQEYENVLDPPSGAHTETLETIRRRLTDGGWAVLASVGDAPAGFAFYEPAKGLLYFGRLSVLPRWRNMGVGSALLDHVERRAREMGTAGVRLGVRLQLPQLVARYERLGYRITTYMTHAGYARPTFVYMEKRF